MERAEVVAKIRTQLDELGSLPDNFSEETNLRHDAHLDSLDRMEFVVALEQEFHCQIPDDAAEKLTTVKEVVDFITGTQTPESDD